MFALYILGSWTHKVHLSILLWCYQWCLMKEQKRNHWKCFPVRKNLIRSNINKIRTVWDTMTTLHPEEPPNSYATQRNENSAQTSGTKRRVAFTFGISQESLWEIDMAGERFCATTADLWKMSCPVQNLLGQKHWDMW